MISLALSVALMSSSGGLLSERTPAAGLLVGAVNLNEAALSLENLSESELTAERARLLDSMPSLGAGIALTAAGGGVLLLGLTLAAVALDFELLIVGLVVMAASVPLLIIGPILLFGALRERRAAQAQVRLIDQRLAELHRDQLEGPRNDGRDEVPPPPPVRPPGSQFAPDVPANLLIAAF